MPNETEAALPGTIGLLGDDYPGYFATGDTNALRRLLQRAETEPAFYRELRSRVTALAATFRPQMEKRSCKALLLRLAGIRKTLTPIGMSKTDG